MHLVDPLRKPAVVAVLLLLLTSSACAHQMLDHGSSDATSIVRSRRQQWNVAFASRDSSALANLVDTDAVHVSTQFTHVGRSDYLSVFLRALATRPQVQLSYQPERVIECARPSCGIVTEYGQWRESWLQDGEATEVSGTYYAVWVRLDGEWRIRREAFATLVCHGRAYCGSSE